MHRYGPCSPNSISEPSLDDTLARDARRVASLQTRISGAIGKKTIISQSGISIGARNGAYIGTGNYVVTLGLGTPKRAQTVEIDTGSDICWVQCRPCVSCYAQVEPIFNPALSTTYRRLPCGSAACLKLGSGSCSAGSCVYSVQYGDGSTTIGPLSADSLAITSTTVFPNFVFGCGTDNRGLLNGSAGLIGLDRGTYSLVTQTSSRLGKVFSYCFPYQAGSVGRLTLGPTTAARVIYTPMLSFPEAPSFYKVDLIGITVGATRLPVAASVFRAAATIIDSGTVITRLPASAYAQLRAAFRSALARFSVFQNSLLDTCYDFTGAGTVSIPIIKLHYTGADVKLGIPGILYNIGTNKYCLAFAGNPGDNNIGIIGNVQQRTFEVVYDIGKARIGFATGACA